MMPFFITKYGSEANFLVLDLNVDPSTGAVTTALGGTLDGKEIKKRLYKLSELQRASFCCALNQLPLEVAHSCRRMCSQIDDL